MVGIDWDAVAEKQATNTDSMLGDIVDRESKSKDADPDIVTLSTGIKLRLRPYGRLPIADMYKRFPAPEPPRITDEERGIVEENRQDPDWLEAMQVWMVERWGAVRDYMLMVGTAVEYLPDGVYGPDDDDWLIIAETIQYPVDLRKPTRYLAWLKVIAIPTDEDMLTVVTQLQGLGGVTEEHVAAAAALFRGNQGRGANPGP